MMNISDEMLRMPLKLVMNNVTKSLHKWFSKNKNKYALIESKKMIVMIKSFFIYKKR